jgi:hypothetical protein
MTSLLLVLSIMIVVFLGPWQNWIVDVTRQRLFEVRDRLFDEAMRGRIFFEDPAYLAGREDINAMIRFCHRATWINVTAEALILGCRDAPFDVVEQNCLVAMHLRAAEKVMLTGMVLRSPFLIVTLLVLAIPMVLVIFIARGVGGKIIRLFDETGKLLRTEATIQPN